MHVTQSIMLPNARGFVKSPAARADLYNMIREIWQLEDVPEEMACSLVVPIFENKGSSNNMEKFRLINLRQSAMKVLAVLLLKRVMSECRSFLPKTQTAYQSKKSTQQNT